MKRSFAAAFTAILLATGASAQVTTVASVSSEPTGDATYSLRVIGANGVAYDCKPDLVSQGGQQGYICTVGGSDGTFFIPPFVPVVAGGLIGAGVIAGALNNDSSSSTTTTGSN